MLRSVFGKKGVCSKSVTKTFSRNKFLVSEFIFKLVYHWESCRWSEICCVYRSGRPEVFCKKGVLRNFAKFTGKHLCQSLSPFLTEHLWWLLLCARDIAEKSLNRLLLLPILKSNHRRCHVEKGVLKNFTNFTGKHLCWSLFLIKPQVRVSAALLKWDSSHVFSSKIGEIFKNTIEKHLLTTASVSSCVFIYNHEKDTANET